MEQQGAGPKVGIVAADGCPVPKGNDLNIHYHRRQHPTKSHLSPSKCFTALRAFLYDVAGQRES